MPSTNAPILAFNRGTVSRKSLARVDLRRLAWSAEQQTNWMSRSLGSMSLRPGLEYIDSTDSDAQAKHIDFIKRTVSDQAIIEITNQKLRVRIDEDVITRVSVSSAVTNGAFTSDVSNWTDADESGATSAWATGGYLSLTGTRFNAAIRRQEVTVGASDQNKEHGLRVDIERGPVTIKVGSTAGGDDYVSETALSPGTHSLAFTPTGNFHIEFSNREQAASLVDSVAVEGSGAMELTVPWETADLKNLRWRQSGDVIFVACDGFQQRRIERRGTGRTWSVVLYQPKDGPFRIPNITTTTLTPSATTGDITLTASRSLFDAEHVGALFRITSIGQFVEIDVTAEGQFSDPIRVIGVDNSRHFSLTIAGTWSATVTLQRSISEPGSWTDVTTFTANTTNPAFNDGLDNQIIYYRIGVDTGDFTSGTVELSLSYSGGGIDGVARVTAYTSETVVSAAVLTALGGTAASTDWSEGVWSAHRGFPTAVRFYEGRLWWTGRDRIIGSVSDAYDSFDDTIEGDSGPINRTLGSGPVDFINWLVDVDRLLIGAEGAEISARSSSFDEPLTPTNFNLKDASNYGSAAIDAVKVDKDAVFVQRDSRTVLQLSQINGLDYQSIDLTILAPEIAKGGFEQLVVQRRPDTRIHCRRTDGTVAILIFYPLEDVRCWLEVDTDGVVEDMLVMPGASEDLVYYTVRRTINSATKRYLERWALEAEATAFTTTWRSDAATTAVTDLDYEDDTVVTVRDVNGAKIENLTVTDGAVTLSSAAAYARITPSICKLGDSFLVYSGVATSTITGLSHLEAKSVVVFADGMALRDSSGDVATFTVASGEISLTDLGSSVTVEEAVVGLSYTARWKGTKMAYASALGTALGQQKRISSIALIGHDMHHQGVKHGPSFSDLRSLPKNIDGRDVGGDEIYRSYDFPPIPFAGNTGADERVCIEARAPRPATLLGAIAGIHTGDRAP